MLELLPELLLPQKISLPPPLPPPPPRGWGGGGGLLDPKLGIDCETGRESGSSQPVKVAHMEGAVTLLLPIALVLEVVYKISYFRRLQ